MYFQWIDFICVHLSQNPFTQGATMCRWFAYISTTEPCLLEDVILLPEHAIAKQVHERYLPYLTHYEPETTPTERSLRNSPFNLDGLGLVW